MEKTEKAGPKVTKEVAKEVPMKQNDVKMEPAEEKSGLSLLLGKR